MDRHVHDGDVARLEHDVWPAISVGRVKLLGNGFQNVPSNQPVTRNIPGMFRKHMGEAPATRRALLHALPATCSLFPTFFGMVGNHESELVETPIIEANARCVESRFVRIGKQ